MNNCITTTSIPSNVGTIAYYSTGNAICTNYPEQFKPGDRVAIKENYYKAGTKFIVLGLSVDDSEDTYILENCVTGAKDFALRKALEPAPYTTKETAAAFCEKHGLSKKVQKSLVKLLKSQ